MSDQAAQLRRKDRVLTLLLGSLALGIVAFIVVIWIVVDRTHDNAVDSNDRAYDNALSINTFGRQSCARQIFDRVESIRSDERQHRFFLDAAKARAAGKTKLDLKTAAKYRVNAEDSSRAAGRTKMRLLDADLDIVRKTKMGPRGSRIPSDAAVAEADRSCAKAFKLPKKSPDPPYVDLFGLEI